MPASIALVGAGRCRPTPDRIPLGASCDRHGGCVVAGGLAGGAGQGLLPVLGAPLRGVGRVHGDDGEAHRVGHRDEAGAEPSGGQAGNQLPEAFPASVFLAGLLGDEVQVLHRDRPHPAGAGPVQEPGQGVAELGVAVAGGAGQVVAEAARIPGRVAVHVQAPGGQVVGVHVHPDHPVGQRRRQGNRARDGFLPGGGHIPARAGHIVVDAVGDRPVDGHPVGPLRPPVREPDPAGEHVPAVRSVRQIRQRGGEPEADLSVRADADGFVPVAFPALPVRLQEPAGGFPAFAPLGLGEPCGRQLVPGTGQALAAAHHVHPPGRPVGAFPRQPVLQHLQPTGFGVPLPPTAVPARRPLAALLAERQRQPVPQGPDTGFQGLQVGERTAAGQRPLLMRRLRDRTRPPGRRQRRQLPLAHRPRLRVVPGAVVAARLQIATGQRAQMRARPAAAPPHRRR
ncbi:hypothetical protein SHIRM173S_02526 [Streptomyces hirsutus]